MQKFRTTFLGLLTLAIILVAHPNMVRAESGQALSISPPLIELTADPGQTVIAKVKLTNISSGELLIKSQANDFAAKDETGDPKIILDDALEDSYGLRRFVQLPAPFTLISQQSKVIEVPIIVPKDAEPGGHYGVIRFTGVTPGSDQSNVAISASIGPLVLLQVKGDIKEQASVVDFYAAGADKKQASLFEFGPVNFVARIRNEGNVHVKPTGTIVVTNMFGAQVASLRVNGDPADPKNPPKSVLPKSIRHFDTILGDGWLFGYFQAKMTLAYGQGQTLTATNGFWVIPYKLIIGLIILLVGGFYLLRFGIKKYNAHIIEAARGRRFK